LLSPKDIAGLLLWFGGSIAAKWGEGQGSWIVAKPIERIDHSTIIGVPTGYWKRFGKTAQRWLLDIFENGKQAGEWTTYDARGKVAKITTMKSPRCSAIAFPPKAKAPPGDGAGLSLQ
jgi:hypothetical protein